MDGSAAWQVRLAKCFDAVKGWCPLIYAAPRMVEPGSGLAGDDRLFPEMPVSLVAWSGLITSIEHLDYVRTGYQHDGKVWPAAQNSPLRAALIGASQALWVVSGSNRRTRQERALRIAVDDWKDQRKAAKDGQPLISPETFEEIVTSLNEHLELAQTKATQLGIAHPVPKWPKQTSLAVIEDAAHTAFGGEPEHERDVLVATTKVLWRTASGDAHSTPSSRLRHTGAASAGGGLVRVPGSIQDLAMTYSAVTLLTSWALNHFDRIRRNQSTTARTGSRIS